MPTKGLSSGVLARLRLFRLLRLPIARMCLTRHSVLARDGKKSRQRQRSRQRCRSPSTRSLHSSCNSFAARRLLSFSCRGAGKGIMHENTAHIDTQLTSRVSFLRARIGLSLHRQEEDKKRRQEDANINRLSQPLFSLSASSNERHSRSKHVAAFASSEYLMTAPQHVNHGSLPSQPVFLSDL